MERDEPLTPFGRVFNQPNVSQIIHCIFGVKNPIDVEDFKSKMVHTEVVRHPRFCSLLVTDSRGREHWRKTQIKPDQHVIVHEKPVGDGDDEDAVNSYVADLCVSTPLDANKPLWEVHLLVAHKCVIFRIHHALGDGISLMALLLKCCRRVDDPERTPAIGDVGRMKLSGPSSRNVGAAVWWLVKAVFLTVVFVVEFLARLLWKSDRRTVLSGCEGVEMWPRKIATAKFTLDDMKAVKKAVPEATINDVLFGVISSGLSRYLEIHSSEELRKGLQVTGVAMVNLRKLPGVQDLAYMMENKSRSSYGNKLGAFLLPVHCFHHQNATSPLLYVKKAKAIMDRKKQSFEAPFTFKFGDLLLSCFGPKAPSWICCRILCHTTFNFTSVIGPQQEITMAGNPLTYIRVNNTSLPNALTMQMVSYAGRADMQILAAKDIIPDPKVLARFFEDSLLDMKEAAAASAARG